MANWFQDSNGTVFTTPSGQAPTNPMNVTVNNNGQTSQGWFNGTTVQK